MELGLPTRGGARKGAGRKPRGLRAGVVHRVRPVFARRMPVHVTLRMAEEVWSLRSRRSFRAVERALAGAMSRFDTRIVQFSVQGNHIHLLVEAGAKAALTRAIKGLSVRLARGLNRIMGRSGRVIGDRYHAHLLRTPTEVRHAVFYIRHNRRHHRAAAPLPPGWIDPYSSDSPALTFTLPPPTTWLVRSVE